MEKTTTTTTREYDANGNLVKEVVTEIVEKGGYIYPYITPTNQPKINRWEITY